MPGFVRTAITLIQSRPNSGLDVASKCALLRFGRIEDGGVLYRALV